MCRWKIKMTKPFPSNPDNPEYSVVRVWGLVLFLSMLLSGCGVMVKLGLKSPPDLQQRRGSVGTAVVPFRLNPFEKVNLVLAGDECRTYCVRVPAGWYVKFIVTVVNRKDGRQAYLKAMFKVDDPTWAEMSPYPAKKQFFLNEGSNQAVVAVANQGSVRDVPFELCQEGPPLDVILQPETFQVIENYQLPQPSFGPQTTP